MHDLDLPKSGGRGAVGHPAPLPRLAFTTRDEAVGPEEARVGHAVTTGPKLWGDTGVDHILEHLSFLAVLNFPERISPELEVVALLIDAEAATIFDVNTMVDATDQVIQCVGTGLQSNVSDSHDGDTAPTIRTV